MYISYNCYKDKSLCKTNNNKLRKETLLEILWTEKQSSPEVSLVGTWTCTPKDTSIGKHKKD